MFTQPLDLKPWEDRSYDASDVALVGFHPHITKMTPNGDQECGRSSDGVLDQLLMDEMFVTTLNHATPLETSSDDSISDTNSIKQERLVTIDKKKIKTMSTIIIAPDEVGLSPIEIRRKRNRESMQRARLRQRDDIETMKITVRELELQFNRLSSKKKQQLLGVMQMNSSLPLRPMDKLEAEYRTLADLSRQLKAERFTLEKILMEKHKTQRRLQQAMIDRKEELDLECPTTVDLETLIPDFDFTPMTEQQADAAIKQCYEDLDQLEKLCIPLSHVRQHHRMDPFPPTCTFGWQMVCHLLPDCGFFVSFTKSFPTQNPEELMMKSWKLFSRPENNNARDLMKMQTLQVVNENAYVVSRDAAHPKIPGLRLRSMFLRFRLQTEKGYVIGRACVNPANKTVREVQEEETQIQYGDFSSWFEFKRIPDQETGCEVKFGAVCAFETDEDIQIRLVNALAAPVGWESLIISSPLSIPNNV